MSKKFIKENECYSCKYKRNIPGDTHYECVKEDPNMTGKPHGIKMGWFNYPYNFAPIWKTKRCDNFTL